MEAQQQWPAHVRHQSSWSDARRDCKRNEKGAEAEEWGSGGGRRLAAHPSLTRLPVTRCSVECGLAHHAAVRSSRVELSCASVVITRHSASYCDQFDALGFDAAG